MEAESGETVLDLISAISSKKYRIYITNHRTTIMFLPCVMFWSGLLMISYCVRKTYVNVSFYNINLAWCRYSMMSCLWAKQVKVIWFTCDFFVLFCFLFVCLFVFCFCFCLFFVLQRSFLFSGVLKSGLIEVIPVIGHHSILKGKPA